MVFTERWFDVPIYFSDLSDDQRLIISDEISKTLEETNKLNLSSDWGDGHKTSYSPGNSNYIDKFELENFRNMILFHVENYRFQVNYLIDQNFDYEFQSWINFSENGGFHFEHNHDIGGISGVYYHKTNGQDGNITFFHPSISFIGDYFPFTSLNKKITYEPKEGRIILFPSWVTHRVEVNKTNDTRISIAFNITFKTK